MQGQTVMFEGLMPLETYVYLVYSPFGLLQYMPQTPISPYAELIPIRKLKP